MNWNIGISIRRLNLLQNNRGHWKRADSWNHVRYFIIIELPILLLQQTFSQRKIKRIAEFMESASLFRPAHEQTSRNIHSWIITKRYIYGLKCQYRRYSVCKYKSGHWDQLLERTICLMLKQNLQAIYVVLWPNNFI